PYSAVLHAAYRGAGPAINGVLGGQGAVYFAPGASSLAQIKPGKVRAIAVSWPERLDVLPDVPTYAELGYKDINDPSWFGLVAPKSMPAAQVARIQKAVAAALKADVVMQRMAAQGQYPTGTSTPAFSKQIETVLTTSEQAASSPY